MESVAVRARGGPETLAQQDFPRWDCEGGEGEGKPKEFPLLFLCFFSILLSLEWTLNEEKQGRREQCELLAIGPKPNIICCRVQFGAA